MHANASAIRSATVPPDDDVNWVIPGRQEIPETGGTAMAHCRPPVCEHGIALLGSLPADRQDRGKPTPLGRQGRMPHRIDAPVDTVQPSRIDVVPHSALSNPQLVKLPNGHHTVLPSRDSRDRHIGSGDFPSHIGG